MIKKKKRKRFGKIGIVLGVFIAFAASFVMNINKFMLEDKLVQAIERKAYAENLYEAEMRRNGELEELAINIKTRKFIEEVAREKFGLTYKNEIIFEPDNE